MILPARVANNGRRAGGETAVDGDEEVPEVRLLFFDECAVFSVTLAAVLDFLFFPAALDCKSLSMLD